MTATAIWLNAPNAKLTPSKVEVDRTLRTGRFGAVKVAFVAVEIVEMVAQRPAQSQMDAPAGAGLRRYRRRALAIFATGVVLFAGFFVVAGIKDNRADELQRTGLRVPGVVTATCGCGEGGSVTARYEWNAAIQSVKVRLNSHSRRYHIGQAVVVLVDANDSGRVTLLGEENESPITVFVMGTLLIGGSTVLLVGTWCLVRVRRQRRIVEKHEWVLRTARWTAGKSRRIPTPQLALATSDGRWQRLRLAPMTVWRLKASGLRAAASVEIATNDTGRAVLRTPNAAELVSAKLLDAYVPDDAPPIDPTRPPLDATQRRNIVRYQTVGLVVFAALSVFSVVTGPTWRTIFYAAMTALLFVARRSVRGR